MSATPIAQHAERNAPEPRPHVEWVESSAALLHEPDPGPTPFLVDGLITEASVIALIGSYKAGKTWLTTELAVGIVTGAPVLDRFAVRKTGPVLLVLEESGRAAFHRRLDPLTRGKHLEADALADLHFAANRRVRLDDPAWRASLLHAALELEVVAIFLDPFVRLKGAGVDENVQSEVAPLLDYMRDLRDETGATVTFTHHVGHQERGRMRGSSDLEGYWESKVTVERHAKTGVCKVSAEHREAEATEPVEYVLRRHDESETIALTPTDKGGEQDLSELIVRYVERHPGKTGDEIAKGVGKNAKKVREVVQVVQGAGRLWKSSGGRDDSGQLYRRGGWYPAAHAGSQGELSRPAGSDDFGQQPSGGTKSPSRPSPKDDLGDDPRGRDGETNGRGHLDADDLADRLTSEFGAREVAE